MASVITSRVGRKPVAIPSGVNVTVLESELQIKGVVGQISVPIHQDIKIAVENSSLNINIAENPSYYRSGSGKKLLNALPGTTRANIQNAIDGVSKGFERKLQLVGVGYKAQVKGGTLELTLGFSHLTNFIPPAGVTIETPNPTEVVIKGVDKNLVGHIASKIRAKRPPNPYKGKGVRYSDEIVIKKETKKK